MIASRPRNRIDREPCRTHAPIATVEATRANSRAPARERTSGVEMTPAAFDRRHKTEHRLRCTNERHARFLYGSRRTAGRGLDLRGRSSSWSTATARRPSSSRPARACQRNIRWAAGPCVKSSTVVRAAPSAWAGTMTRRLGRWTRQAAVGAMRTATIAERQGDHASNPQCLHARARALRALPMTRRRDEHITAPKHTWSATDASESRRKTTNLSVGKTCRPQTDEAGAASSTRHRWVTCEARRNRPDFPPNRPQVVKMGQRRRRPATLAGAGRIDEGQGNDTADGGENLT